LITAGLISTTGNIAGGNILSNNYFYANGTPIAFGVTYTASTTPPAGPEVGDQWYNTTTDVLYEYLDDGTTDYWVDIISPAFAAGVIANVQISGSMLVNANITYDIGSSVQGFRDVYANTFNSFGDMSVGGNLSVTGNINASGNIVGDRIINGTTSIEIQTAGGNANINIGGTGNLAVFTPGNLVMTGNINPSANITYDLGTTTQRWKDLYLANSTIYLGNSTISANATAITITNPAGGETVLAGGSGATSVTGATVSASGNITGGNVLTGGLVSATGNITGSYVLGNGSLLTGIDATGIQSGTSNVKVVSSGGNATISIGGTSNVAVFATTGVFVTGVISASGNVNAGNVNAGNITIAADLISSLGATLTIDPATSGNAGLVVINGNLQVNGTTTTINSNVVSTNDLTVNYANNAINSAAANGGGIEVGPIGSPYITWLYNNTANTWTTAGGISATGDITGGNLSVSTGTITVGNIVNANGNGVGNIGSSSVYFNTGFLKATTAQYADLAENYLADAEYTPGTVLDFDGELEVTISNRDSSKRVAGVVSTNPAHLMNGGLDGAHVVAVALVGRVPVQVTGKIAKGDLMVSAGNGRARAEANPVVGTVIGKALENFDSGEGTIEIVISMQ
jgi:hypothetical protein